MQNILMKRTRGSQSVKLRISRAYLANNELPCCEPTSTPNAHFAIASIVYLPQSSLASKIPFLSLIANSNALIRSATHSSKSVTIFFIFADEKAGVIVLRTSFHN
uniref:Uncharacterized protein n=1 Tax=Ascaris lumbricoides TaxID=6252 RepID=A0A0M3HHD4_ASCLU